MSDGTGTAAFDYPLPPDRIAQEPAARREAARLMVLDRSAPDAAPVDATFAAIGSFLRPGDLLVLNDSRVFPARLPARKPSGGRVDLLLLKPEPEDPSGATWRALASSGRGLRAGLRLSVAPGFEAEFLGEAEGGRVRVRLLAETGPVAEAIERHGVMPLPPYIRREPDDARAPLDRVRYQTAFARETGSIAAPTAGLHFTPELIEALERSGVVITRLTLHVGPGTFQPVRAARIEDHRLEPEWYRLPEEAAAAIAACRAHGGRVAAVGTTVTRVLESRAEDGGGVRPGSGLCDLYITPGHRFRVVDLLITNFHLPKSSLLVLVSAFAGRDRILAAYREAIARGYRFYSYGDAMLIR
ncbi:MAG: tRNA preQ1(34) S-adenosylmethionine ribosyltransferase-isomerase QueA [Candidatus Polarisedimenticolia bacterium]